MNPSELSPTQAGVLADVVLSMLRKQRGTKTAAMATILSGRMNELEPADFRRTMRSLLKSASGSGLDVIGELYGLSRGVTVHGRGQSSETDSAFVDRLLEEVWKAPNSEDTSDQLVGFSLRTILHFRPDATLVEQENAIKKAIKAVERDVQDTEVVGTFRVNELWFLLRFICQDVVTDVGQPNRPFEEILLWREGKPEPLIENYRLKPGERLVIEGSIPVPIDLRPFGTAPWRFPNSRN